MKVSTPKLETSETIKMVLSGLEQALMTSDYSKLVPHLSTHFKAGNYSDPLVHQVIPQILQQYPKLMSLTILEESRNSILLDLEFEQIGKSQSTVLLQDDGKILGISLFDDVLKASEVAAAQTEGSIFEAVESFQTKIEIAGSGLVMVKAKLNGIEEDFLLDTGAPAIVLNTSVKGEGDEEALGVAGQSSISEIEIDTFDWNGIRCENKSLLGMDLSHLEVEIERPFKGLIGFTAVKDYILSIDYGAEKLFLTSNPSDLGKVAAEIPFQYQAHIPVVELNIDGNDYLFGLDTGAEKNLLDLSDYKKLDKNLIKLIEQTELVGADGNVALVDLFSISNLMIDQFPLEEMEFVASDISHLRAGYGLDIVGLLGFPFLNSKKIAIDFGQSKILILE